MQRKDKPTNFPEGSEFTRRLVTRFDPNSATSEDYRDLRTNLLYSIVDRPPKTIVLTSPGQAEGKSTTCANLGIVMAQAAKSTLIIDCDFRRPTMHKFFALDNTQGIADVLMGERSLQEVWREPEERLKVLPIGVGTKLRDTAEIIGSRRFSQLLARIQNEVDYTLIDASPVGLTSDSAVLATQCDGVLLVLDAQKTRKRATRRAIRRLKTIGANVLATVITNVEASRRD